MSVPSPAAPNHLLRLHSHPVSALEVSPDNKRIYSGDSSGLVVTTSSHTLRAIARWQAHSDGLLGIEEWGDQVITHGRDNKLCVWGRVVEAPESTILGDTAARLNLTTPQLSYALDVNALNYCRFSLLCDPADSHEEKRAMIALPGLIDSTVTDIWTLPSRIRIHTAIGEETSGLSPDPNSKNKAGIIMALHLYLSPIQSTETCHDDLRLICAYENGSVTLRRYTSAGHRISSGAAGWVVLWTAKPHAQTIMAMRISRQNDFAISVSADHLVCRYDLRAVTALSENVAAVYKTKHPGNSSITISDDGKVCAIGSWDGSIRLYSARTFKSLGTLRYHKTTCQVVIFAKSCQNDRLRLESETNSDDEMLTEKDCWLIGGGKDCRVSIWSLMKFSKP